MERIKVESSFNYQISLSQTSINNYDEFSLNGFPLFLNSHYNGLAILDLLI